LAARSSSQASICRCHAASSCIQRPRRTVLQLTRRESVGVPGLGDSHLPEIPLGLSAVTPAAATKLTSNGSDGEAEPAADDPTALAAGSRRGGRGDPTARADFTHAAW
jgi:hypothetical protein